MKKFQTIIVPFMAGLIVLTGFAGSVSAETSTSTNDGTHKSTYMRSATGHRLHGKVTAINGMVFTVTTGKASLAKTYTVDASVSKFEKNTGVGAPVAALITDIAVGDVVSVSGTITGMNVAATDIIDGAIKEKAGGTDVHTKKTKTTKPVVHKVKKAKVKHTKKPKTTATTTPAQ